MIDLHKYWQYLIDEPEKEKIIQDEGTIEKLLLTKVCHYIFLGFEKQEYILTSL